MFTETFPGRYLLWRAPTDQDHTRFPSEPAGKQAQGSPLPCAAHPIEPEALSLSPMGVWKGGSLQTLLQATGTTAFMALHEGHVICEWYAAGHHAMALGRNLSVTKSIAFLLVGQAVAEGQLPSVDVPIGDLVPGIVDHAAAHLTLAQLMRMSSGIGYREGVLPWSDDARIYHGTRLRQAALHVRVTDPVDAFFHYNDWHPLLLAIALERVGGASVAELLASKLWGPLDAGCATMTLDRSGPGALAHLESGFNCTVHGLARFGQLMLQKGEWGGRQLVARDWLDRLDDVTHAWHTAAHFAYYRKLPWGRALSTGRFAYKDFWWHHLVRKGVHDLFAMGALGAHVYVSPDTRCVLVRQSSRFPKGLWWASLLRGLAEQIAQA